GPAYSEGLAELFAELPVMRRFRERYDVRLYRPIGAVLDALVASYHEWGGRATPPRIAIVDWREVPTYSEFELLRDAFTAAGVPTLIADPRDLECVGAGLYAGGTRIDLVYRRVLINDILAREADCRALLDAYESRAVWVAQEKIQVRRELFPICEGGDVVMRDMLIDFAPYVFRGRLAGFLTRLSATGLANVTSGGGQVPAFAVQEKQTRRHEDTKKEVGCL